MRILPLLLAFGAASAPLSAQANCTAGAAPPTTLWTMNPFAGGSLYGHPNFPNPPGPTFPGFSFVIDMQPLVDIEISRVDLDLYDDGNLVQVSPTVTVTSPNQVGATVTATLYLHLGPTWVGNETNQSAWTALGTGTLTVAPFHTDSPIVFNPPIVVPAGAWGVLIQVPQTTTGPNPGPLHPMVDTTATSPGVYTDPVLTMVNVQFQRESWVNSLTSPSHTQSLEVHYQALNGYANWTTFGTGCGQPSAPQLRLLQRPLVGTTIDWETSNVSAGSQLVFWLLGFVPDPAGTSLAPFGLPGCNAYLSIANPLVTNVSGVTGGIATLQLPVPNDPSFSGVVMYTQSAPAVSGGSLPFHASNAICIALGLH